MKCPHCLENFHADWTREGLLSDNIGYWSAHHCLCPSCKNAVIAISLSGGEIRLVHPRGISRSPIPVEVDDPAVTAAYKGACLVLVDSPEASAALSRRCLQHILREKAGVQHGDLYDEIQEVIDSGKLPSDLTDSLHSVRVVGNFGTHPIKSKSSGEIEPVELGEAEWNLDVIESLMDYYFVRPEMIKKRKDALNIKLKEAGKPELS